LLSNRALGALACALTLVIAVGTTKLVLDRAIPEGKAPPAAPAPKKKAKPAAPAGSSEISKQVFIVQPVMPTGEIYPGGGTGFLLATRIVVNEKIVVTNRHVCEAGAEYVEQMTDGADTDGADFFILRQKERYWMVKRLAVSEETDLCLLSVPSEVGTSASGLPLGNAEPTMGEQVIVYGHPFLRPLTRNEGTALNIFEDPMDLERTLKGIPPMRIGRMDFIIMPGNSGSPLLNQNKEVVGVVFAMEVATKNGLYLPLNDLKRFLKQYASGALTQ
jgi:S1-C subfamily serine protease